MVMKTKDIVSAALVTAMTIGVERVLNKYSKNNKLVNQAAAIGESFLALEYLRSNGMVPVVGDIDINRKSPKKNE